MSEPAIRVENLSKQYHIGEKERYRTLRESLLNAVKGPIERLRRFGRSSGHEDNTIWALKDVSFELQPGEVLGIIGPNGAGKSTLLKILSKITEPTRGRAVINGRVGSLLEVGTGFHSELTGRENVYLSGAILGMRRDEIDSKFDEIVAFSGVEKYIDTPVKRYSSGMRVRLGFAVAAHLDPEILLIDEVLAVGDAEFRKKCLGKMDDVARGGRTVLFVSHNMAAITGLCSRAALLNRGKLAAMGPAEEITQQYLRSTSVPIAGFQPVETDDFRLTKLEATGPHGQCVLPLEEASITLEVVPKRQAPSIGAHVLIEDQSGYRLMGINTLALANNIAAAKGHATVLRIKFAHLPLAPGSYRLHVWLKRMQEDANEVPQLYEFSVAERLVQGQTGENSSWYGKVVASVNVTAGPQPA